MPSGYNRDGKPNKGWYKKGFRGAWKGGRIQVNGYVMLHKPEHPFCANNDYVYEHRIVMEKNIGRYLTDKEVIHHINDNTLDNRIENLMLFNTNGNHLKFHAKQGWGKPYKKGKKCKYEQEKL